MVSVAGYGYSIINSAQKTLPTSHPVLAYTLPHLDTSSYTYLYPGYIHTYRHDRLLTSFSCLSARYVSNVTGEHHRYNDLCTKWSVSGDMYKGGNKWYGHETEA